MKSTILYYLNLPALPLVFLLLVIKGMIRTVKDAIRGSHAAYRENRRAFGKD